MQQAWARDGFLIIEGFASLQDCADLIRRAEDLVAAFAPESVASIFSTKNQTAATDNYFLESGPEVRFFFEEEAFDEEGHLRQNKTLSINKIGHALHDKDPLFNRFSRDPRLARMANDLGFAKPLLMQSMYIFKQPFIGGEVVCHQDSTFLYTDPMSVTGFWFALQDATRENGCLWVLPGGHKDGLKKKFRRLPQGGVAMETISPSEWPPFAESAPYVPLEAKAGTLVLLHGLLPHLSCANRSARSRHAYTLHIIDGAANYPADNWLHRNANDPARGF